MKRDIVVFDLECTCWDDNANMPKDARETIEIGAVRLGEPDWDIVDKFDIFIKPVDNPVLTQYCTDLTTITQNLVDSGVTFAEGLDKFHDWSYTCVDTIPLFLSWGYFDKNHLVMESGKKKYTGTLITDIQKPFKHINVKERFAQKMGGKPCGVSKALNRLNIPFTGTQHRGCDDAANIAKIAKFLQSIIGF